MKLSVSNIGWNQSNNEEILEYLKEKEFNGIEIAPTILIKENPYDKIEEAKKLVKEIKEKYGLEISSMQSIWYGKQGNIFNKEEAKLFIEYTKKAIDFASAINCKNLVFGCPKNRNIPDDKTEDDITYFFKELGEYAKERGTVLSIEPNPTIYGTNFINYTKQAFEFVKKIDSQGVKVNIDFGTIIENKEDLNVIFENIDLVNHIHISEPNLVKIKQREEHVELFEFLKNIDYNKYVSIEMKQTDSIKDIKDSIDYVKKVFSE